MRTIISNDLKTLYGRIDYNLLEKTRLSTKVLASALDLPVLNSYGLAVNDFICLNDPGEEQSELRQINSISGQTVSISTPTSFNFDNKTNIYKTGYDLIKFYGDSTVIATVSVDPSYLVSTPAALSNSVAYSMSFLNTTTSIETEKGEPVYVTDKLLCSPADVFAYESTKVHGSSVIIKSDIASRDIRDLFLSQDQNVADVDNRDLLRSACALSSLRYIFLELSKSSSDTAKTKSNDYKGYYDAELSRIMAIINLNNSDINVRAQTTIDR